MIPATRSSIFAVLCQAAVILLPLTLRAQTYLDNESLISNQDPNTETRRSDHFRVCFGHYNRDSGMGGMSEWLAQGNLQMFEQMRNRWVNEMGLHDNNSTTDNPTPKYRSNFHFLMTWNDGGGGGAYASGDPLGYGWAMANPGYCRFDPPSGATPHENGHAWQINAQGFNGSDSSGAWWESHANWMQLQFLNDYPGPANVIYNPMYYPAHGRDYYDTWTIFEAAKDDTRYGPAWVSSVWTDATPDQREHEYILDRMIRLDTSGSADKAGAFKDLWGDMVRKLITWDYERQQWFAEANKPDDGSDWEFFRRCRTPLVKAPGMPGWFRPARGHWPMEYGFNLIPLTASPGTTVTCNFQPVSDPARQADWRACLVAVNANGDAHYSTLWNVGTNSITLSADETKLYLTVTAVPKPMKIGANLGGSMNQVWQMQLTDAGLLFPYTVSFTNTSPRNASYAKPTGVTWKSHTNPDGSVCNNIASGATVDATAYVGPNAMVLDSARVLGSAKLTDYAVVRGSAQVRDTAEVSGYALVQDSAQIYGHGKVRDWAEIYNDCTVYGNGKVIEHGYVGDHGHINVSGSSVVKGTAYVWSTTPSSELSGCLISDGDTANGGSGDHGVHFGWNWGPDPSRFTNLADNGWQYCFLTFDGTLLSSDLNTGAFARDYFGVNHGLLMNGCRQAVDTGAGARGGYVLPFNGIDQYVELPPSTNDFSDTCVSAWVKWTGTADDQRVWSMGDGVNKVMHLTPKDAGTGKLRFVISNGTTTQSIDGPTALGSGWTHVAVTLSGTTATLYVNGTQVGQNTAMTLSPDSLNAPLMENANYLGRGNAGNYFQGSLDEFRVYMKALDAGEISTLFSTAGPAPVTETPDTAAPSAPAWLVEPGIVTDDTVTMSAAPGTDASGWIEYYFRCVSGGGHDSGWVSFNKYTDAGVTPGATPTYTVKLRDRAGNTTSESTPETATGTPASLGTPGFRYGPVGIANGQITMSAAKVVSASGKVEYKFDRVSPSAATSGWQASPNWTQTGLTTGTTYGYTVTVRDNRGNTSVPSGSASATAQDDAGPKLCIAPAHWKMQPYATIDNKVSMTARVATDPGGVQYSFHCVSGGGPDSGWQDSPTFLTPGPLPDGSYVYQYKLRDKSARNNESPYSVSYAAKITPTTGYHAATFAQLTTMPDDNLVDFTGLVVQVNTDHYVVKDAAGDATIMVQPDTYGRTTAPANMLKICRVKGHLWTSGGVRLVTYAAVTAIMDPPAFAVSGGITESGSGSPLAGATVYFSLQPDAVANAVIIATTDLSGNFTQPVPNGTWYMAVAAADHFPATGQPVSVNSAPVPGVNFALDPAETISATVTGGGTISPEGVLLLASGASQTYTITPFGGHSIASVLVDGVEQGSVTSYTFTNVTANHTLAVTFAANNFTVPQPGGLLFSALTDTLPYAGPIAAWPTQVPGGGSLSVMGSPTANATGGAKWARNKADGDGFRFGNYPEGTSIPMNGGTIVVVAKPAASMAANNYQCLVSVLLSQFAINVDRSSLQVSLGRKGNLPWDFIGTGVTLTQDEPVILSYVVQPTGELVLYKNGQAVFTNNDAVAFTSLAPSAWFGTDVSVGKGWNGDGWSSFNGDIGDVFVYQTALAPADRQALEAGLSARYGIAAPYTITASAGSGGTISPAGATAVSNGGSATFVAMPAPGYAVGNLVVDGVSQGVPGSYSFSNVTANHTISVVFVPISPSISLSRHSGTGNPTTYGDSLSFDVVAGGVPWPTGTVTLHDGGTEGLVIGSGTLASGICTITPAANALTAGVHGNLVAVFAGDINYGPMTSTPLDPQTVAPKALTVTGAVADDKVYDGTTAATLSGTPAVNGVVPGDTVTLDNTGSGSFADQNVGTNKPAATAMTLSGNAAANYSLTQPALVADITPRVVVFGGSRPYDGTNAVSTGTGLMVGNNIDGANLVLTGTAALAGRNAGPQEVVPGFATPVRVRSATGFSANNATSFTVTLAAVPAAGNTLVAVVSTRGSTADRVSGVGSAGATWARAAQSVNTNGSTTEIWYAPLGAVPGAAVTFNHAAGRCAAVVIEYSGLLTAGPSLDQANAANSSGNGTAPLTGTTTVTSQAAELWVGAIGYRSSGPSLSAIPNSFASVASAQSGSSTATNNAKVYALERIVAATGAAATGGTLSATVQWSGAIATFKAASSLTLTGPAAGNYTLTGATGLVTVTAAPVTVAAVNASKTYDGTPTATGTPTVTPPLVAGDMAGFLSQAFEDSSAGVGNKVIVPSITISDGNGGANYQVTKRNYTTGTILKATAGITLANLAHVYDGTPKAATAVTAPTGLNVDLTYSGLADPPIAVGNHAVEATINSPNHAGSASGTLVIADPVVIWRTGHFTPAEIAAGLAADDADPDGDGVNNRTEYAFGLDPKSGASVNPITVPLDSASGRFRYTRLAASGLVYHVLASSDLQTWAEEIPVNETVAATADGVQIVEVTVAARPVAGKLFVRVEAR